MRCREQRPDHACHPSRAVAHVDEISPDSKDVKMKNKPQNMEDVDEVRAMMLGDMHARQADGRDGHDVALGVVLALRSFVIENVGADDSVDELVELGLLLRGEETL